LLINGDSGTSISAFDRGLQYGDGLFETIAVVDARPCLWGRHYGRLLAGGKRLGISIPPAATLLAEAQREIGSSHKGVIKITVTRGEGGRGYRSDPEMAATRLVHFSSWPDYPPDAGTAGVSVRVCNTRLGSTPALAGIKHLNRLEQVLARSEWSDAETSEGLMLDSLDQVIEGTMSNIFMLRDGAIHTPDLSDCGIEGVMRALVLDVAAELGRGVHIRPIPMTELLQADSLFLTNSLIGVWPVRAVQDRTFKLEKLDRELVSAVFDRAYV
jgi:4-amino-4-deoxychorismate lyase